ncbi:MAG: hypothetical protein AB8G99_01955 [Planctomycetaceae bacterium]
MNYNMSSTRRLCALVAFLLMSTLAQPALAQRQRGVVKDLLKDLIESQLRKEERRRGANPANLGPGRQPANMSPEERRRLRQLKPLAAKYVNSSAALATGMSDELRSSPALRPLVARALQLNATASALARRLDGNISPEFLSTSLRQIDQEHRQLAFQVGQIRPAPQRCIRDLQELDRVRDQVTTLYELQPQVNFAGLNELSSALNVTLDALVEDVNVELRSNSQWRKLVQDGRRVQSQCRSFRYTCTDSNPRDVLVSGYQEYLTMWQPYADRLESFNNPYLARQVRRAHDLNRQISQQLLIPIGVDRTRARHLSELIESELKQLYGFINLNVLANVPDVQNLPAMAASLKNQTHGFCECVTNNESPAQMKARWNTMYASWTAFTFQLDAVKNRRIRTLMQEIDSSILALRDVLGIVPEFDRRQVTRLAASVDNLSDQMQTLVGRWGRRGSLPRGVKADLVAFHNLCHGFHDSALDREPANRLLADCDRVVTAWRMLNPRIAKCQTPEAVALNRLSEQVTVSLVQLETLLAQ